MFVFYRRLPTAPTISFPGNKKPLLMARRGDKICARFSFSPDTRRGWNWHLAAPNAFNRLPWRHRASPSATLHETVVSTDADKLIDNLNPVN